MQDFVHLHVHSQYSLLDGQASVSALVDKAINDGMPGIALTDHGNMFGIKDLFNYCKKKNKGRKVPFVPIFGCEMYCAHESMHQKKGRENLSGWHLIVLAKNELGYKNLIKLVSKSYTQGFYGRPRTDKKELKKYKEGLIISSACLGGEIPQKIMAGNIEEAEETAKWFRSIWGEDFYLEIQRHKATKPQANKRTYEEQERTNPYILDIAKRNGIKVICTNDVHFVDEENAEAHDRLICLSTGKDLDDPNRMHYTMQEWMKTTEEMNNVFSDVPETLANTMEILEKIEQYDIDHGPIMPTFAIPESFGTEDTYREKFTDKNLIDEFTQDEKGNVILKKEEAEKKIEALGGVNKLYRLKLEADYLKALTFEGAKTFYPNMDKDTEERIIFELHVMKTMGFPGYFLIVQDFIAAGRKMGVSIGPGRGSAAGSAVAYCLQITKIDPIKYDLLFERFLNPDRISLPDIDIDLDDDGRSLVLQWVTEKYGEEKVAHIITYGTMASKSAIKDVARVENLPLSESNRLCSLIPDKIPDKKVNLRTAIEYVPELRMAENSQDPKIRNTIKYAKMLEGNVRNVGVHACGVIICRDDITDWVPVSTAMDKKSGEKINVTQYEGRVIEETGLIKMDFLGLKNLSIIKEAIANIKLSRNIDIDIDHIPIDDELTYRLYSEGRTIGTFQFESPGMQKHLRKLRPTTFEDLIAMNALYRPGPMDNIPSFIRRKHGLEKITYDIPIMKKYLKETYGITVYQEQVMLLSRLLANFTRGESDGLRKAMGKKLREKLDAMKPKFIKGGVSNGHDPKVLEKIWTDWEKFASYAFNKSHATCYSWIAYQTAYLKAHYPAEFMAACMSRSLSDITTVTKLMDECKAMGIKVLGPDINESQGRFSVNKKGDIRFGLSAIKGVGESAVASLISEREKLGSYTNPFNFIERANLSSCNKRNVECLILSGAFDSFNEIKREQFFENNDKGEIFLELFVRYGQRFQQDKNEASNSLFGQDMVEISRPNVPLFCPWSDLEKLNKEKDLVGIYISAHPLDRYRIVLDYVCNIKTIEIDDLSNRKEGEELVMGGIITNIREGVTKVKNKPYGIVRIEDYSGSGELALFGNNWANFKGYLSTIGAQVVINATIQQNPWNPDKLDMNLTKVRYLSDIGDDVIKKITIRIPLLKLSDIMITELYELITKEKGNTAVCFDIVENQERPHRLGLVSKKIQCRVTQDLLHYIKNTEALSFHIN